MSRSENQQPEFAREDPVHHDHVVGVAARLRVRVGRIRWIEWVLAPLRGQLPSCAPAPLPR